jgi:serine/threonine-protein kinase
MVPGERFGQYTVEAELGRGGQAIVYRARQEGLARDVALKVFDPVAAARGGDVERFRREAIAAAKLQHPRIVTVYDAGEIAGRAFIAMQLVAGSTLGGEIARRGPLPSSRALRVLDDIAQALDFAHKHGLVHRDVKTANILIDLEETAYLSDFGLARMDDMPALTRRGDWMGTAEYVAPEIVEGNRATPASDIYAFAACCFEALTGRPPYVHAEASAVLLAHVREPIPAASALNPSLSPTVDRVFESGLSKDPALRPQKAAAIVDELRVALAASPARPTVVGEPAPVLREDPWTRVLARFSSSDTSLLSAVQEEPSTAPQGVLRRLPRRFAAVAAAIALLVVAGVAVGGFFLGHSSVTDPQVAREEGFAAGSKAGFARGRSLGLEQGMGRGKTIGRRAGLAAGKREGLSQGRIEGYQDGYSEGRSSVFGSLEGDSPIPGSFYIVRYGDNDGISSWWDTPLTAGDCYQITLGDQLRTFESDVFGSC